MNLYTIPGSIILVLLIFIVIGGALLNKVKNIPGFYKTLIGVVVLNLILTTITPEWSLLNLVSLERISSTNQAAKDLWGIRGQIGDIMSGHFAALAFIALLITIDQMKQSLQKQKDAIKIQEDYFKKQEYENHFFRLYDEFINAKKNIDDKKIFESYNDAIRDENITNIKNFKTSIYTQRDYPKSFFNLLEFIMNYIDNNVTDKYKYEFLIKNRLSNVDLIYIALHDICNNNNINILLNKLHIFENLDVDDDEIIQPIILLIDYDPLQYKLQKYKFSELEDEG